MRQKRAKAYRKLMALYSMSFGFRQPYQVLVDSLMSSEATNTKVELAKQLENVLQGNIKPMITQCCIHELYLKGPSSQPAVDLAKSFERRKCNHREPIPGDECLLSVIGDSNKHRYVIATQSQSLRLKLRQIPAVPIVHINRAVMVLEPPSDATLKQKEMVEETRQLVDQPDAKLIANIIAGPSIGDSTDGNKPTSANPSSLRRRKGPKGPNPLSIKKKKPSVQERLRPVKRKREDHDSHDVEKKAGDISRTVSKGDVGVPGSGHKRRRRRKNGALDPNDGPKSVVMNVPEDVK